MTPATLVLLGQMALASGGSPSHPPAPTVDFSTLPASADVQNKAPDGKLHPVRARLLLEQTALAAGSTQRIGLHLQQQKEWHTYWKSPGDIGLPTDITWKAPPGVSIAPHVYPVPERFEAEGIVSFGYQDQVLLMSDLAVPADLAPGRYEVHAAASWLVCQSSCIPGAAELTLPIEVVAAGTPVSDAPWAPLFGFFAAQHPLSAQEAGITVQPSLSVPALKANQPFRAEFLVKSEKGPIDLPAGGAAWPTFTPIVAPDWVLASENPIEIRGVDGGVLVVVRGEALEPDPLPVGQEIGGLFQLSIGGKTLPVEYVTPLAWAAADAPVAAAAAPPPAPVATVAAAAPEGAAGLAGNLLFAFIGGLILNVMPCVLPVLTLKLYGLVEQAEIAPRQRHIAAVAYTLGILASFWALAASVVIARVAFGIDLGWGSQFQYPPYVAALATLTFGFGLSLFGVFEIPAFGVETASGASTREGAVGYFFTGIFATLLATPCSAPFLGTAVAFAFSAPTPVLVAIFSCVALGLAAPFAIVAFIPRLYALMPKPGEWMDWFKQLLGFSLVATSIWLVGVLASQIGSGRTTWFMLFLLGVAIACWVYGRWGGVLSTRTQHAGALAVALGITAGAGWFFVDLQFAEAETCEATVAQTALDYDGEIPWQDFSPAAVDATAGNTVFVDFTADWCLTCKVNEKTVLSTDTVRDAMRTHRVVPLKGDWTVRDPVITEWLARYGKAGVPFYLVIPADRSKAPIPLPEIITPEMVAGSLRTASQ
jgi:thiol:disulfide interchange protein DsbD